MCVCVCVCVCVRVYACGLRAGLKFQRLVCRGSGSWVGLHTFSLQGSQNLGLATRLAPGRMELRSKPGGCPKYSPGSTLVFRQMPRFVGLSRCKKFNF